MRYFVKNDFEGNILSIVSVKELREGMEHPFGFFAESEFVNEVTLSDEQKKLSLLELHEKYKVDILNLELVPATEHL